jgi:SAM-dependent methyltransferase
MTSQDTSDRYLEPYRKSQAKVGSDFEVTLWASPQSQRRRFQVFREMCMLDGKRVLDAGCSRGDLAEYLVEAGVNYEHYIGIDGLPEVIEFARARGLPRSEFHAGDFVREPRLLSIGRPDVVCISGTLNTMTDEQVFTVLEGAWQAAGQVLMFNFLSDLCSDEAPVQDDFARRLSATQLLRWATARTWCVVFRQDYFRAGHDATIMMRRV